MPRFRVTTFGKPVGRWLPTIELAAQDAVERGDASRDPFNGRVTLSVGTSVQESDGPADTDEQLIAWGKALVYLKQHREQAEPMAREAAENAQGETRERWRDIAKRIGAVMADARAVAEREGDVR